MFLDAWVTIPLWCFLVLGVGIVIVMFFVYNMGYKDGLEGRKLRRGY